MENRIFLWGFFCTTINTCHVNIPTKNITALIFHGYLGQLYACPKSAHVSNDAVYKKNATLFDAAFIKLCFFLLRIN